MGAGRDERAFVRAAQRGSASGIEALFRLHWPRAHRAAYLVVHDAAAAEDIAQEAFLAAIRNLDRFDRRRPFGPRLHRIVVNRAIDSARARQLRGEVGAGRRGRRARGRGAARRLAARGARRAATDHRAVIVLGTCSSTRRARSQSARLTAGHRQLAPAPRARPLKETE